MGRQKEYIFEASMEEEKKLYRIAEVVKSVAVASSTIRFWAKEFPQIKPQKNAKGTVYYTHQDLQTMLQIKHLLKDQGMTIEGARQYLKSTHKKNFDVVEKLKEIRTFLEGVRDALE